MGDDGNGRPADGSPGLTATPSHSRGRSCAISAPVTPACFEAATPALAVCRAERSWSSYK